MSIKCNTCVNHARFSGPQSGDYLERWNDCALCYVWGINTSRGSRGCDYWESNPKLARNPENTPKVPSVSVFGVVPKEKCNVYDHSTKDCRLQILTAEIYGRWYNGISFGLNHGSGLGWGSYPCIHDNSYATEREAINDQLLQLRKYVENCAREETDVIEYIKSLIFEQRQLTLF